MGSTSRKRLAEQMLSGDHYNDLDACPIVFNYRNALELYLKAIIRIGQGHAVVTGIEVDGQHLNQHSLAKLVGGVRQTFRAAGWEWDLDVEGLRTFADFEAIVRDFDGLDSGSFTFRYPVDKHRKATVPHAYFIFSVPDFVNRMDALLDLLKAAALGLGAELEVIVDSIAESHEFASDPDWRG
jgi:hypothetical protein